jgi:lysozyme
MADLMRKAGTIAVVVSAALMAFTAANEGTKNKAYVDPGGVITICTGHTEKGLKLGAVRTSAECQAYLQQDLQEAANAVGHHVAVAISRGESAAYTDFIFNVGEGNFARSTLVRKLNKGDHAGACKELLKWVYVDVKGKATVSPGIKLRREREYALCIRNFNEH